MENFVLVGKANTVFQLIKLMAKGEKVEKSQKIERILKQKSCWQYHPHTN